MSVEVELREHWLRSGGPPDMAGTLDWLRWAAGGWRDHPNADALPQADTMPDVFRVLLVDLVERASTDRVAHDALIEFGQDYSGDVRELPAEYLKWSLSRHKPPRPKPTARRNAEIVALIRLRRYEYGERIGTEDDPGEAVEHVAEVAGLSVSYTFRVWKRGRQGDSFRRKPVPVTR